MKKILLLSFVLAFASSAMAANITKHCPKDPFAPCHLAVNGDEFHFKDISLMSHFSEFDAFLDKYKMDIGYFIHDFSMGGKSAFSLLKNYRMMGIFKDHELIGILGICQEGYERKLVDFSTYIVPRWRNFGLGSASKEEVLRLFKVHKSVDTVRALIHKHNGQSQKSIQKLGFENKFDVYQKDLMN